MKHVIFYLLCASFKSCCYFFLHGFLKTFCKNEKRFNVRFLILILKIISFDFTLLNAREIFYLYLFSPLYHRFSGELGRHTYITPTSYLTLISSFKQLLREKQEEIKASIQRYKGGLGQLEFFSVTIIGMQKDIEELKPKLVVAQKEAEEFIEVSGFTPLF